MALNHANQTPSKPGLFLILLLFLLSVSSLDAQTISSGNWNDPAIWTGGVVPGGTTTNVHVRHDVALNGNISISSGTYYFGWNGSSATSSMITDPEGGPAYSLTLSKAGGYSASQCVLDIRSGTTTFEGPASLDNANLIIRSGATLIVGGLTISNNTRIVIEAGGTLIVNGDVIDTNNGSGSTIVQGFVQINGNYTATTGSVEIEGSGTFQTTGSITTSGNSSVFGSTNDCTTGPCSGASLSCGTGGVSYTNSVSPSTQSICVGQTPSTLTSSTNAPVTSYQWQVSTTNGGNGFSNISGATASTYSPDALAQGTWYRVIVTTSECTSTSPSSAIDVMASELPTTADAGSSQGICAGSAASLNANTPTVGTGSWSIVSGPDTNVWQLSNATDPAAVFTPATSGSYTLRWTIANACATSSSDVNIEAGSAAVLTWTGIANDEHWSNPQNWSCPQTPANSHDVVIPDGANVIVDNAGFARNLTVSNGATLTLQAGMILEVSGDFVNNGTFNGGSGTLSVTGNLTNNGICHAETGTVLLTGSSSQFVSANNAVYHTISINKSGGEVTLTSPLQLQHLLSLESATNVNANGNLTILSRGMTTDLDGSIGPILNGGTITGNVKVERYMDAIGSTFRYIASPVKNVPRPAALPNIYRYSPTGWVKYTGNLTTGEGYATSTTNKQITWNATGEIHTGARTWNFPNEGWYLIGNPYPSAIHWFKDEQAWVLTSDKVSTTIAVTDNSVSGYPNYFRYYQYDSSNPQNWGEGPLVNGVIAMGQSFWVYSLSGGSLTIHEPAKATAAGEFYRDKSDRSADQIAVRIDDGKNMDQAFLRISKGATPGFELKHDLPKLWNPEMNLYMLDASRREMLRHTVDHISADEKIWLGIQVITPGEYHISFANVENFSHGQTLYLVDQYEGVSIPASSADKYSFTVSYTSGPVHDRFYLTLRPEQMTRLERPLLAYPNPVKDKLTLRSPDDLPATADVYDQQGKRVSTLSWTGEAVVDMQHMQPGMYVLKVKTTSGILVRKVIRE